MSKQEEKSFENAVIDISKGDPAAVLEKEANINLDVATPHILLQDRRRLRTKSVGRPPTQVFLKTTVLRSFSMDSDNDETPDESINHTYSKKESNSLTTFVDETQQKHTVDSIVTKKILSETYSANWKNITLKKTTGGLKQSKVNVTTPPWLKEVRERKNHKLSLRGDEFLNNSERERHTVVEVNVPKTRSPIKNINEDRSINEENVLLKLDENKTTIPEDKTELIASKYDKELTQTSKLEENVELVKLKQGTKSSKISKSEELTTLKELESTQMTKSEDDFKLTTPQQCTELTQSCQKYSTETNDQNSIENVNTASGTKEIHKKDGDDTSAKYLEDTAEKIRKYTISSKNFQKKIQEDLQNLIVYINNEFEKQMKELEAISTSLVNKNE